MKVINITKKEHMLFPHILRTEAPEDFIEAIIERKYEGTENWSTDDLYNFEETPDVM